ncbi:hypothetical protein HYPBUDRAFT_134338 [Hyphopichia burtonii NRRL Y-1933]|uniref:Prokaryotic-type class I peptide chain release factors domain-containing protein n=1 Tax=Hyphopichia burtonii NRRL Y-1933 TaxID=984485 RepID=A0A1E4RMP3_9ASCO|nr:hypothetical protein HYPBUDRAFT_134338 [Hyphopichia burtonii NRRL Y-1933]ODV68365.1 hypothetical protein HYPBUDRAFT_134338 [Hyphopichia burtonii NRRL Y-1933]
MIRVPSYVPLGLRALGLGPVSPAVYIKRAYLSSNELSQDQIDKARTWLESFQPDKIPRHIFEITYSRASGPGGQKVNKTSSKATISMTENEWLDPKACFWIPFAVRTKLSQQPLRYQTKSGGIVVQCDTFRTREVNTDECFKRLLQEIRENVHFAAEPTEEDKKRWEEIKADRKEKRLFNKKKQSDKKKSRSKSFDY